MLAGVKFLGDLNPAQVGSDPNSLVEMNGLGYFAGRATPHSMKLWKTNGTFNGTTSLKEFDFVDSLTNVDGRLFFSGTERFITGQPVYGRELWKTDGTSAGTVRVRDIIPGVASSTPHALTNVNGTLLFGITRSYDQVELWKSNGTQAGTVRLHTFTGSSTPLQNPVNVKGTLYFRAHDATHGSELWKSDGTAAGTKLVKDVAPGAAHSYPTNLVNVSGKLFFTANDGQTGVELWVSNGTAAGTMRVKNIAAGAPSSYPNSLTNVNGTLFFSATDGAPGTELWKSNGLASGTARVHLAPGATGTHPHSLTNVNGQLFFTARVNETPGLWKWDPQEVRASHLLDSPNLNELANVDGTLFFSGNSQLWKSNGTKTGTVPLTSTSSMDLYPRQIVNVAGKALFAAQDARGRELWKSNGTTAGTSIVADLRKGTGDSLPQTAVNRNGTLFFRSSFVESFRLITGPWKSDGTAAGTRRVANQQHVEGLVNVGGTLFFGSTGKEKLDVELWKSNGTEAGTVQVKDLLAGGSSYPRYLTDVNGTLFFIARDHDSFGLWRSNGTAAGTILIKDLTPASMIYPRLPNTLRNVGGTLYFSAANENFGVSLWKSDGTSAGTIPLGNFSGGLYPKEITNVNGTVYFQQQLIGGFNAGLWKSDGTEAGTTFVSNKGSGLRFPVNVAGTLYFSARSASGVELWKSDGTDAGTVLVKDIIPGTAGSYPTWLTNVGGLLLFGARGPGYEHGLWRSDGTPGGTTRVKNIAAATIPSPLANVDGTLYFTVFESDVVGAELWRSDGSSAGTVRVNNAPRLEGDLRLEVNGNFFFSGYTPAYGVELYVIPADPNLAPKLDTAPAATLWSVFEDSTNPAGTPVKTLVATAQTDPDLNAKKGIAITAATGTASGRWQYSLDNGQRWSWIGVVSKTDARLLPSNNETRVRFVPYKNFNGQVKLSYRAWDQTQGVAGRLFDLTGHVGGRNAFSLGLETASLTVKPVNDAPVLTVGAPVSYAHDTAAIRLAPLAMLADVDSANFSGGRLRVHIDSGASISNRLAIAGSFTIDASNYVRLGDKVIGRRTGGGYGVNDLVVVFNANATRSIVQQLARAIAFKTVGGAAGQRSVLFTVSDGDGGTSDEAIKTVNVT